MFFVTYWNMKSKVTYRLVDEGMLRVLLDGFHTLCILQGDGVDAWEGYMEGREDYLNEYSNLVDNRPITIDDLVEYDLTGFEVYSPEV